VTATNFKEISGGSVVYYIAFYPLLPKIVQLPAVPANPVVKS
jgi:hypothetical protein